MWLLFFLLTFDPVVFLTWKRDPQHTMTVVWLTKDSDFEGQIQWKLPEEENFRQKASLKTPIQLDKEQKFYLFQAQLNFLKPDQVYEFKIENEKKVRKFKTAPTDLKEPVRFISGGDLYHDEMESTAKMMRVAAKFNPLFSVLGGDLAYAFTSKKSEKEELDRWFNFLSTYEKEMLTPEGVMIPLLPILGNHDIRGGYLAGARNAKFFFTVFPMPGNLGYAHLDFGKWLSLLLLDSGHANPVEGAQTAWLQKSLEEVKGADYLFAFYHVGAYPSVRSFIGKRAQTVRKCWTPLFDRFDLTAAFEHHDHALKRSVPILGNNKREGGILYLGDGSFGITTPRTPHTPKQLWYLAYSSPTQAVWAVTLTEEAALFEALSVDGTIVDHTTKLSRKK